MRKPIIGISGSIMIDDEESIRGQLQVVDSLLLSGGHDVNPILYGEEPRQKLGTISPKRDKFDIALIKIAMEIKMLKIFERLIGEAKKIKCKNE